MLQALLEDRFQLKLHRDMKEFPVYGLLAGKDGLKMQEAPADAVEGAAPAGGVNVTATGSQGGASVDLGRGSSFSFGNGRFEGTKLTMPNIAETFTRFLDRPVVDMTDLKGKYSFALEFSPEDFQAMMVRSALNAGVVLPPQALRALDSASGDSVFAAVQKLGLRLEQRRAKLEVVVVDSMAKSPTEN
jgi:uncharacterized protein (TIGR03435 family)